MRRNTVWRCDAVKHRAARCSTRSWRWAARLGASDGHSGAAFAVTPTASASAVLKSCAGSIAAAISLLWNAQASLPTVREVAPKCTSLSSATGTATATRVGAGGRALRVVFPGRVEERETTGKEEREEEEEEEEEEERRKTLEEAFDVVRQRYVDECRMDWGRIRRVLDRLSVRNEQQLEQALEWLFSQFDDPFTRYLTAAQLESVREDIEGEMCGVGIVFGAQRSGWGRGRRIVVKQVVRNSPAAEAGLMEGDWITAIDMERVGWMSFEEATERLVGAEGRKVVISFVRNGVEVNVVLRRRRFEVPTVWTERVRVEGVGEVGYVRVGEFAAHTASEVRRAMREMDGGVGGRGGVGLIVLDMRGNCGGLVDKAVEVAKMFLEREQVVVRLVGRDGRGRTERCGRWGGRRGGRRRPVVVVVDGETASASELVAAALRDNCRGVVVGRRTFGKGSVQAIVPLRNGGGAAVTVATYRTPRDARIVRGRGLRPDLRRARLRAGAHAVHDIFGGGGGDGGDGGSGGARLQWIARTLQRCAARRN